MEKQEDRGRKKFFESIYPLGADEPKFAAEHAKLAGDPEKINAALKECDELYAEQERLADLPYAEFLKAQGHFETRLQHSGILARTLMPAISRTRLSYERNQCSLLLLRAGIQVALNGEQNAAATMVDPYSETGAAPFKYQKLPDGFDLSSALMSNDKPVSLRFAPMLPATPAAEKPPAPPENPGQF
jgi:hypothetical protein